MAEWVLLGERTEAGDVAPLEVQVLLAYEPEVVFSDPLRLPYVRASTHINKIII